MTTDLSKPPKRPAETEVTRLKTRARRAAAESRAAVAISVRVPVALYKALVELAEEYHQPVSTIALQCLEDGTRKYRDFSRPGGLSASVTRTYPELTAIDRSGPSGPGLLERLARNRTVGRPQMVPDQGPPLVTSPEDVEDQATTSLYESLSGLPVDALLPQSPALTESSS